MATKRSVRIGIQLRRQKVADLYLQGLTQMQIGERIGIKQPTVCVDLKRIQETWRQSAIRDFDLAREIELKKIDRIERESWAAWVPCPHSWYQYLSYSQAGLQ